MAAAALNIPNALSGVRILLVPVLLWLAWTGNAGLYLGLLAISLVTDFLDGFLARRLGQTSTLGVKLDSWGDLLTYGAMVLALYWLWPETFWRESGFLAVGIACYLVAGIASLAKFRQLPRYHTWAAKLSALLMAPAYYLLTLFDLSWPFRVVVLFHVWVALEEVLITFTLNRNQYNVPTWLHARRLARRARDKLQDRRERVRERREARRRRLRASHRDRGDRL